MENNRIPRPTPEVLPAASPFAPQTFVVASLITSILIIFLFSRKRASSKGTAFLLVGPSDAGKTAILSQLAFKQTLPTQTSMQTNFATVVLSSKKTVPLIDIPGHPRLRGQFVEQMHSTKVVGFVVDVSTISRNASVVAEHLHHILHALTSLPPSRHQPALLILAHKCDLLKTSSTTPNSNPTALAINRVKTILERELEKRRVSQTGGINIEGLGEEGEATEMGGLNCGEKEGSAFRFDEWEGGEVSFLGTSVMSNASQPSEKNEGDSVLESLWEWMEENL